MQTIDNVVKVYNGRVGCMCGCRGTYSYTAAGAHVRALNQGSGAYDRACVNERRVRSIAKKVLDHPNVTFEGDCAFVTENDRTSVIYFNI